MSDNARTRTAFLFGLLVGALIGGPVVVVGLYVALHRNWQKEVRM